MSVWLVRNKTVQRSSSGSQELWECSWWWCWCRCWCGPGAPTILPPCPQLSPLMVLLAVTSWDSTRQGQRSCCSLVTEAGSVLLMSQPLTCSYRCHPHRGSSSLQQSRPWGQGCLLGAAKPRRAASTWGRRHRSLRGLVLMGELGTLWGVFLL